jgi:cytochrome P450
LHHNTRIWDNPDGFDRAMDNCRRAAKLARDAYMPFSSGPYFALAPDFTHRDD